MSAFVDYNYFCYILQLKEYRMDRIKDFLSTKKGAKLLAIFSGFSFISSGVADSNQESTLAVMIDPSVAKIAPR